MTRPAAPFTCHQCGAEWAGHRVEHCPECHSTFSGTTAGDLHRVGPWTDRRCLTPDECYALSDKRGKRRLKLQRNAYGTAVWGLPGTWRPDGAE